MNIALYLFVCVWISDEAVILVFNVTFLVCGYQIKHPFSRLLYYFSAFGYQIKKTLFAFVILLFGVWINTPSRVCCITFRCLDIRRKKPFSCLFSIYYFSVFGYQIKHPFSCLLYYFSVFGYQMKHSFPCLLYYILVFGYQIKQPFSCL